MGVGRETMWWNGYKIGLVIGWLMSCLNAMIVTRSGWAWYVVIPVSAGLGLLACLIGAMIEIRKLYRIRALRRVTNQ